MDGDEQMTLEGIEIMRAEDLPIKVRTKEKIFTGFVELRYERSSPLETVVVPIKGTFSQRLREVMKNEEKIGCITFLE